MVRASSLAVGVVLLASAATAADYRAPRTIFGAPSLEGVWTNSSVTTLQRPAAFKSLVATEAEEAAVVAGFKTAVGDANAAFVDPAKPAPPVVEAAPQADVIETDMHLARIRGEYRTSAIVDPADGRIPFTDAGRQATRAANRETFDDPESRPSSERCLIGVGSPDGPPMINTAFNSNYQIVQTPDYVAINIEMNHAVRVIRLADRKHLPDAIRPWMGDSFGWWDGDTLVVETANLNPQGAIHTVGGGFAYSAQGRLTERFTRVADDRILYEFTVDDPVNFTRPWSAQMPMRATKGPIYEYACHEGNYSLPNALAGARAAERNAQAPAGAGQTAK